MAKIRFCGNCNPDVHPRKVREAVELRELEKEPVTEILIDGCERSCLSKKRPPRRKEETLVVMRGKELVGGGG